MIQNGEGTRWFSAILLAFSMGSALQAQSPDVPVQRPVEYRVLPRAVKPHSSEYAPASAAPNIVSKPIQPYAYGWFGAKTHTHWHRQFGTRRAYSQWTLK